ncbi:MAG TPA: lipopolysaccharide heptosyltransferase I [Pseudomonadales bacterium]
MRVLLVKMSSLGDVVHALPAVTDAAAALGPSLELHWVVEEAFAAIPARHPAVAEVIPVAWRRWRRNLGGSRGEMRAFLRRLRSRRYDLVLDAQGLLKSAAICALARGPAAGFARRSAREGAAALFYRTPVAVPRGQHAVDRLRQLFACALRYPLPPSAPQFGLTAAASAESPRQRQCVLLHGTTWASKEWPVRFWRELAARAAEADFEVLVPWGNDAERARAHGIADGTAARVLDREPLERLTARLAAAELVVGVDSGLTHLAAALGVPTVAVYGSTAPQLTGVRGPRAVALAASEPECVPCLRRECTYQGPALTWRGAPVRPDCYASVSPERVWRASRALVAAEADGDVGG